jgi:hypothetical protein
MAAVTKDDSSNCDLCNNWEVGVASVYNDDGLQRSYDINDQHMRYSARYYLFREYTLTCVLCKALKDALASYESLEDISDDSMVFMDREPKSPFTISYCVNLRDGSNDFRTIELYTVSGL